MSAPVNLGHSSSMEIYQSIQYPTEINQVLRYQGNSNTVRMIEKLLVLNTNKIKAAEKRQPTVNLTATPTFTSGQRFALKSNHCVPPFTSPEQTVVDYQVGGDTIIPLVGGMYQCFQAGTVFVYAGQQENTVFLSLPQDAESMAVGGDFTGLKISLATFKNQFTNVP